MSIVKAVIDAAHYVVNLILVKFKVNSPNTDTGKAVSFFTFFTLFTFSSKWFYNNKY